MSRQETAEITALQALGWLVGQPEELGGFLNASGASPGDLARLARDPHFLAAMIDFLLETDDRVLACTRDLNLPPTALGEARQGLPGGRDPHWT
ncbi:DUF3572 domain-containing protein [Tabrizicola oligotrophica]|uniref:DUF3572 domain-containing protein n=1 Tax=Tabrizicola oligotrophica TaxID=2710650 RepID=A0A6M0QYI1_9RHOB|nr:DUF3572 domain-containing protein [Tabrizicola oligotrophica]NEY91884.1 DUF3572 domain-containing protein [Tabrizicola oligotrophica]